MKKKIFVATLSLIGLVAFASCDSKICYCYERSANGTVHETEVYTSNDTPCNSMSRGDRGCIESYERGTIDPNDIAK
jgi:hypothetical protein